MIFQPFEASSPNSHGYSKTINSLAVEWIDPHKILDYKSSRRQALSPWELGSEFQPLKDQYGHVIRRASGGYDYGPELNPIVDQIATPHGSRKFFKDRLMNGWPEGGKLLSDTLDQIMPDLSDTIVSDYGRRRLESGHVSGFDPFVPGMMQGAGDIWRQWGRRKPKPAVQIVQQHGGAASASADLMRWNGALALAMCEQLTSRGIPSEIIVCSPTFMFGYSGFSGRTGLLCPNIIAKKVDEPARVDLLASMLVWPAVERYAFIPLENAYRMPGDNRDDVWGDRQSLGVCELNSCIEGVAQMWPEIRTAMIVSFVYTKDAAIEAGRRFAQELDGGNRFADLNDTL